MRRRQARHLPSIRRATLPRAPSFPGQSAVDRRAQNVGQELHRPVGCRHAAIDTEHRLFGLRPVCPHGFNQVAGLVTDALQDRTGNFLRTRVSRQTEQRTPGVRVPIGSAKTNEGRNKVDVLVRICLFGKRLRVAGTFDETQTVAQPTARQHRQTKIDPSSAYVVSPFSL